MTVPARARRFTASTVPTRLFSSLSALQPQVLSGALALGVLAWGYAPLEHELGAPASASEAHARGGISTDPGAKQDKEAKRAAREAKKKERAARANKSDDRSMAKAKSSKRSSGGSVDLGDNDPLDGL